LKICHQSSINEPIARGTVVFEFKNAYKLQRVSHRKTLGILIIQVLSSQVHMNRENFEVLIASSLFETFPRRLPMVEQFNLLN